MKQLANAINASPVNSIEGLRAKALVAFWEVAPLCADQTEFSFDDAFQQLFTAVAELCGLKDKMVATGYELPDIAMVDDDSVVKFPFTVSRRAFARKPRWSKNGTPEERATLREMVAEEIDAQMNPKIVGGNRPPARSLSTTGENGRLRKERHEVWRMADAATHYWRARLDFGDAVSRVHRMGTPEGRSHPAVQSRGPLATARKVPRGKGKAASHSRAGCCVGQMEANGASQGPTSLHRREIRADQACAKAGGKYCSTYCTKELKDKQIAKTCK
jgi:predicted nucleic acid-binding protein